MMLHSGCRGVRLPFLFSVYFRMPEELRPKSAKSKLKKKRKKNVSDISRAMADLEKKEVSVQSDR